MGGEGFEPPKAKPADLQSAPFDHSGIRPMWRIAEDTASVGPGQDDRGSGFRVPADHADPEDSRSRTGPFVERFGLGDGPNPESEALRLRSSATLEIGGPGLSRGPARPPLLSPVAPEKP